MKAFHLLLGGLLLVALLGLGLFVLSSAFQGPEAWTLLLEELRTRQVEAIFTSLALVLAILLFALTSFRLPEKQRYLAYDIEGGNVSVSLKAVQDFLSRLSGEFAAVQILEPTVRARPGRVDVQLDVKVKAGAQIPELCRMLQDRARVILREKVGISEVAEVRVRVQEIVGGTSADTASGEARPESFT
jgi:uncharacterized alkaline shock family protein YloU